VGVQKIKGHYLIYNAKKKAEVKFRKELSSQIIDRFGKSKYSAEQITDILRYSLSYFIDNFHGICIQEKSVRFYQFIFTFHEQATEVVYKYGNDAITKEIDYEYFAKYRRILKYILETGCEVSMHNKERTDEAFKKRFEDTLDKLMYLGEMIFTCVSLYAEQTMIEDVADISFDEKNLFVFSRRHHYNFIFKHMAEELGGRMSKAVVDDSDLAGLNDLKDTLKKCFNIDFGDVGHLIASIHEMNKPKGGDVVGIEWEALPMNLSGMFGVDINMARKFFKGLTLDKTNKMELLDLACKPYKLNRYIYKPIIIWNIEGGDYALFGKSSWAEAFIQYATNAIPWGKAPSEWLESRCFKEYVHTKENDHDRWLDDEVENILSSNNIPYDRNVVSISHQSGRTRIDVKDLGEIDFIIISRNSKKVLITDSKHLLGRYDIANQRNDYNVFTNGRKPYNRTMEKKVKWFKGNLGIVNEHFQSIYPDESIDLTEYSVEGIFIINTPTFYMYNSEFRIYTIDQVKDVVLDKWIDPSFTIIVDEEDHEKLITVSYPYFKKPDYITFDPFKDD